MIRFLAASLGYLLLAGGFVAAVVDGTRSIASSRLLVMPLREALDRMWPNATPAFRAMLMQVHPALWDPVGVDAAGRAACRHARRFRHRAGHADTPPRA